MRTRIWIAVLGLCVVIATAAFVGQGALATADPKPQLELNALTPTFTVGGVADLEVRVSPEALGGYAHLYAKVLGETEEVMTFPIFEPGFVIHAPVPFDPEYIGRRLTYQYQAFAPDGRPLGTSNKTDGYLEPEFD